MKKIKVIYNWCCENIAYYVTVIKSDSSLKRDRKDSQDPIFTFNIRKGVCEGRTRLLKVLLNNYYMWVPCFLVKGKSGNFIIKSLQKNKFSKNDNNSSYKKIKIKWTIKIFCLRRNN